MTIMYIVKQNASQSSFAARTENAQRMTIVTQA